MIQGYSVNGNSLVNNTFCRIFVIKLPLFSNLMIKIGAILFF